MCNYLWCPDKAGKHRGYNTKIVPRYGGEMAFAYQNQVLDTTWYRRVAYSGSTLAWPLFPIIFLVISSNVLQSLNLSHNLAKGRIRKLWSRLDRVDLEQVLWVEKWWWKDLILGFVCMLWVETSWWWEWDWVVSARRQMHAVVEDAFSSQIKGGARQDAGWWQLHGLHGF